MESPEGEELPVSSTDGKFLFSDIYNYLRHSRYPEGLSKADKNALRKRSKFFRVNDKDLYYIGGGKMCLLLDVYGLLIASAGNLLTWYYFDQLNHQHL